MLLGKLRLRPDLLLLLSLLLVILIILMMVAPPVMQGPRPTLGVLVALNYVSLGRYKKL